ncbi:probable bacterioferritin comigratory protein (Bcp) [Rhodopirellula baltica SH 1]|uniref:Probable bacterioferritin comigratory protein (Bcp) n=2 Tax=Rhodopirellula baltica TaxID=265606 RepID=Q7UR62_RHOBA|nr:probable bacterioferritin comigratory protein (Bcp) [Rhodopirellula baltica SH 1]
MDLFSDKVDRMPFSTTFAFAVSSLYRVSSGMRSPVHVLMAGFIERRTSFDRTFHFIPTQGHPMQNRRSMIGLFAMLSIATLTSTAQAQGRRQAAPGKEPPHPPKVGQEAPDFELMNQEGEVVSLKALTEKSPVVMLVLRGWPGKQCPMCSRQVGEFLSKKAALKDVQVVMIYPGPAELLEMHAKEFQGNKTFPPNYHFVLDPDYKFTSAWGLRWDAPRETAYPSTFVVDQNQKIVFGKTVISHGDRADVATVVAKLP